MYGGVVMSELQMTMQKAYMLSDSEQSILAKLIDAFITSTKSSNTQSTSKRVIGRFDGKYEILDDIDFCNDEIAEMFGVSDQ